MRGNDMLIHSNLDECFFFRCLDKEKISKRKRDAVVNTDPCGAVIGIPPPKRATDALV